MKSLKRRLKLIAAGISTLTVVSCSDDPPAFDEIRDTKTGQADAVSGSDAGKGARDAQGASKEQNSTSDIVDNTKAEGKSQAMASEGIETESLLATCTSSSLKTISRTIQFEERSECNWEENGNLSRLNRRIRAREKQSSQIKLPEGAQICGVEVDSLSQTIHFDDVFALTINNAVVAANSVITDRLDTNQSGLKDWNWSKVVNGNFDNSGTYCLGKNCNLPPHDKVGPINLDLTLNDRDTKIHSNHALASLYSRIKSQGSFIFSTYTTGDDDPGDCYNSGGSFQVKLYLSE